VVTSNTTTGDTDTMIVLDTQIAVSLCVDLEMLEDWLLHASPDTLAELGEFAYHATGNPRFGVDELIRALGHYGVVLRRGLAAPRCQRQ
jgi:hypothetical protein